MSGIENHMVALPQPELDYEPTCNHEYYDIVNIHDYDESKITFHIKCKECWHEGYVEAKIHDYDEPEWD